MLLFTMAVITANRRKRLDFVEEYENKDENSENQLYLPMKVNIVFLAQMGIKKCGQK